MLHILNILADGILTTVELTAGSFAVGAVVAIPLVALRCSGKTALKAPTVIVVEIIRAVPPLVWLFIIYYGLSENVVRFSTMQAAIAGLGLVSAAYLSEIYRAGVEAVPTGQWEAARALSLSRIKMVVSIILPQAIVITIPPAATYAISLLKDTSIASVIGAADITFLAKKLTQTDLNGLGNFAVAGALYIALSVPVALAGRGLDKYLRKRLMRA